MEKKKVPEEQIVYAEILYYGGFAGIILMAITLAIYVSQLLPTYVPLSEMPELWKHNTHRYVEETGMPTGWGWVKYLTYSDIMNFVPLALLAFITVVCYIAIIPPLLKKRDFLYLTIAVVEIIVLLLAASGILQAGH